MARKSVHSAGLDHLLLDLRDARRSLARYPIAAAVAIISLAAGIGGTTATLIARDVMFFSPPPLYQEPDQLSRVTMATPDRPVGPVPGALFAIWSQAGVPGLAAITPGRAATLRTAERFETVSVRAVTPEVFAVVGVRPLLGRTLESGDVGQRHVEAVAAAEVAKSGESRGVPTAPSLDAASADPRTLASPNAVAAPSRVVGASPTVSASPKVVAASSKVVAASPTGSASSKVVAASPTGSASSRVVAAPSTVSASSRVVAASPTVSAPRPVSAPPTVSASPEAAPGSAGEVVLSYRVWQNLFGGRADAVGSAIWIDDRAYVVSGVMPERFWLSAMDAPIWVALDSRGIAGVEGLDVIVRRAPGITPGALNAQLQAGVDEYLRGLPGAERRRWTRVADINGTQLGNSISPVVLVLMSACVLLTLLIAVSNVAILMIAQWTTREQEIGIRAALGASRARVLRLLLTESVLVALAGGLLGICTMLALLGLMASRGDANWRFYDLSIHPGVLVVSAALTLLAGLFAGIAPALYETRRLQANPLRAMSSDRARQRWRHALVVFEIAVTVALLVVTGAMVDGYRRMLNMDVGFATHTLLTARIERGSGGGVRPAEVLDLLQAMPGVDRVAAGTSVPMSASGPRQGIALAAGATPVSTADLAQVSVNFFDTLQVPMRAGRNFTPADTRVAIVNATLANRLWPNRDPLGATVFTDADTRGYQVIGVVADYRDAPLANPTPRLFVPLPLEASTSTYASASTSTPPMSRLQVVIRATGNPVPLVQAVRQRMREAGGGHVAAAVVTFDQIINVGAQEVLVTAFALVPLIGIGILLTAAGVYSVLSFAVARRGRELAVRLAIGASGRDLVRLVVAHSARLVVSGTCIGVGVTFWLTRLVQGAGGIFDSPGAGAFVVPIALVLGVGAIATAAPLRRVLRISPASLLRVS